MRPYQHAILSTCISAILWYRFRSLELSVGAFLGGVLIDADHLVDTWFEHGFRLSPQELVATCYRRAYTRARLLLHGWEWLFIGFSAAWALDWNPWLLGWMVGWSHHLVSDQLYNRPGRWGYFLVFRMRHHDAFKRVYPE